MSEDKGKRRTSRAAGPPPPAEPPQVPEEATLPVAGFSLSETPADARELAAAAATAAAVAAPPTPVGAALQAQSLATLLSGGGALGQFADVMPTFGNVLLSIGTGVAASQEAMDRSLVDTVRELQDTRITIVTDVIQELGDDGLPDVTREPTVVTEEVSLVNHVPPTQLLWDRVALSMDMTVSGISAEHGVVFRQRQTQAQGSAGSFWGFYDWFGGSASTREQTAQSRSAYEQQWASGQVRLDALLGSRR
ncbi:MAG TPA: hypothetical protein VEQ60_24100, partial [Longimicrobium sp.]|nr:hypothetical protein [Longimicrobium sp.]